MDFLLFHAPITISFFSILISPADHAAPLHIPLPISVPSCPILRRADLGWRQGLVATPSPLVELRPFSARQGPREDDDEEEAEEKRMILVAGVRVDQEQGDWIPSPPLRETTAT